MNQNIQEQREKLFEVKKLQLHTGLEGFDAEQAYATFKSTGGASLGIVGKDFTPTQPNFLFDSFTDCLKDIPQANLDTLSVSNLKDGKRLKISCEVGSYGFTNMKNESDEMLVSINIETGFDGTTSTQLYISTFRLICSNGMRGLTTEKNLSFKNTGGNVGKASFMMQDIVQILNNQNNYLDKFKELSKRKVTKREIDDYIFKVTGIDPRKDDLGTRSKNILDAINKSVLIEMQDAGENAWALMNSISRYTNHNTKKNTEDFIYAGAGLKMNNLAQRHAFDLILN